jgi:hypothetical protein
MWTFILISGVAAIWVAMGGAVAYLVTRAR